MVCCGVFGFGARSGQEWAKIAEPGKDVGFTLEKLLHAVGLGANDRHLRAGKDGWRSFSGGGDHLVGSVLLQGEEESVCMTM